MFVLITVCIFRDVYISHFDVEPMLVLKALKVGARRKAIM